jgi:AraC-like DNA-binding protein
MLQTRPDVPRVPSADRFRQTGMPLFVRRWQRHGLAALHTHEGTELVVVLGGSAVHRDDSGSHPLRAGDVFVVHPGGTHGYAGVDRLDLVNVVFDEQALAPRLAELRTLPGYRVLMDLEPRARRRAGAAPALSLPAAQLASVERLLTELQRELRERSSGYREVALAHFAHLLVSLARAYQSQPAARAGRLLRIAAVVRQLEQDPAAPVTVPGLARTCGLSRSAFIRAFRAATGDTPIDYVIRLRVRLAAGMLRGSERSVTDVALEVGFMDGNYFSRQFRRVMGVTPRAYRRGALSEGSEGEP